MTTQTMPFRRAADPIGLRGLPETRRELDALTDELRWRIRSAAGRMLSGKRLASEMGLTGSRAIRLLTAYDQIARGNPEIVGMPGSGYCWGPDAADVLASMVEHARRMGRDWMAKSAVYRRGGIASTAAQLVFDWMDEPAAGKGDELAAMIAAEGVGVGDVLSELIRRMETTPRGRQVLRTIAERHAEVLMPRKALHAAVAELTDMASRLRLAAGPTEDETEQRLDTDAGPDIMTAETGQGETPAEAQQKQGDGPCVTHSS